MTTKTTESSLNHCIQLYNEGLKPSEIIKITGVSKSVIYRTLRKAGIDTSLKPRHESIDSSAVIRLFNKGIGSSGIAKIIGTSASVINNCLVANDLSPRNRSEQQKARMDNSTPEQIKALVSSANIAAKGRKRTDDEIRKGALARFANGSVRTSSLEVALDELMRDRGYIGIKQLNIDKYNADFVFGNVVVEVFGGIWHWHGAHLARSEQRIKAILDSGYHLIIIACRSKPITAQTADNLVSMLDILRGDKSPVRHYRMIECDGNVVISGSSNGDNLTIEWPFTNGVDPASGDYIRIRKDAIEM